MADPKHSLKFTVICVVIYVVYVIITLFMLPIFMPEPVSMQRAIVGYQMRSIRNLKNYTIETGGTPIRSMLVTFKGSDAIDLLESLSQTPGCYHHFAPLIDHKQKINDNEEALKALDELVSLYNCDYYLSRGMLQWGKQTPMFRQFYGHQRSICMLYPNEVCWNEEVLTRVCKVYPFINMSVYNLRLKHLALLLEREDLNVRMVLLVRDPRATMHTRANRTWCFNNPDCSDPHYLCSDMVSDYKIATKLLKRYPDRFRAVRYEDFARQPLLYISKILDFYGLPSGQSRNATNNKRLLDVTNNDTGFKWKTEMSALRIDHIQNVCLEAMHLWGYRTIDKFRTFTSARSKFNSVIKSVPFVL